MRCVGVVLGIGVVIGVAKSLSASNLTGAVIVLLFLGAPFVFYLRVALRRSPVMIVSDYGFNDCRSGRLIPWANVELARVNTHQGAFGLNHSLRLVFKPEQAVVAERRLITTNATAEDEIEVSLDLLSISSEDVADVLEEKLGRPLARTADAGLQNVRRRRR